jgi:dipeptidyl aminopeptidase/acylaminoacyl peptidase
MPRASFATLALYLLSASLLPFPAAAAKSPITHESLWMMKRVAAPSVSPDGKWVVFTLTEPSYVEGEQSSDLWIVPADGSSAPRRLTATKGGESGATWSPDSRRIAFSAKREGDESSQIYLLDVTAGGESVRVTSVSTGASGPLWSPDGKSIAFQSRVYPGTRTEEENKKAAAERKARKYKARVYDTFPIRNWDRWLDDLQTHLLVQPVDGSAPAKDVLAGTSLVAAQGGFSGAPSSGGDDLQPVWTPDSQSLIIVATTEKNAGAYAEVAYHLYQVSAAGSGSEPRALTQGKDSYTRPRFRPDGNALYAAFDPNNAKVYNVGRLAMLRWPAASAPPVIVSSKLDSSVNSFTFSANSETVYITAEAQGFERVYAMPASGGEPRLAIESNAGTYTSIQAPSQQSAGRFLIGMWGSAVNPPEVVRIDLDARSRRSLTSVSTAQAESIDWLPLRHFTFTAQNGRTIHNMVALPPNFSESKKYPLLVLIHGGPHTMWRDEITLRWNYHLLAASGYVVLLTNYTGSTGFGEKFAQVMQGDPLKGPAEEINQAADEAIKRFSFIDSTRQCAGGASYGGHLANWLQGTTTRYRCLISHAGLINMESQWGTSDSIYHREIMAGGPVWEQAKVWREQNPIRLAASFKTPILLTVGENDFRVPLNQTLENWSVLQRLRIPSRLIVFPDANHWILKPEDSRYFYGEVQKWLARYLQ